MKLLLSQLIEQPRIKSSLYYGCLLGVLLLTASSYYLSSLATPLTTSNQLGFYTIVQYTLMAFFMLGAWFLSPKSQQFRGYRCLFLVAILARILLLNLEPYTSNDVDRYLFDGRIAYEGFDPYRLSHDDHALATLRAQWQPPNEHAAYVTLYPPLALAIFSLAAAGGIEHAQWIWKIILLVAGLFTVWVSALVLKKNNSLQHLPLVALSPLLILETGGGLHLDALSTLAVICAVYAWQCRKTASCGAIIGVGMLLKVLPLMLLLPLFFALSPLKSAVKLVGCCLGIIISGYVITIALGYHPIGSIGVFFDKWRFGSPLFSLLDYLAFDHTLIGVVIFGALMATGIAYTCFSQRKTTTSQNPRILMCLSLSLALPLILSPVVFPWYLMPLVPLVALQPNGYLLAWLILMPFTYQVLDQFLCCQVWQPAMWPVVLLGLLYLCAFARFLSHRETAYD